MLFILIAVTLLSMWACHQIAKHRHADRTLWTVLGLLLGPFAVPFACLAQPTEVPDSLDQDPRHSDN